MTSKTKRLNLREKIKKRIKQKKLEQQMGGNYLKVPQNLELFKPGVGVHVFDIIPYRVKNNPFAFVEPGEFWYERTFYVHRGIGVDNKAFICLKSVDQECPICEYRQKILKSGGSDEEFKIASGLKPKERQLFLIFNVKQKKYQIFEQSYHLFGKKLEEEVNEGEDDWADFAEIEGGKTLRVRFSERTLNGRTFLEASRIDFLDRKHKIKVPKICLDDLLNILPYDQLNKVFFEGLPGGDDEFEDEIPFDVDDEQVEGLVEDEGIEEGVEVEPEVESKDEKESEQEVKDEDDGSLVGDLDEWEDDL